MSFAAGLRCVMATGPKPTPSLLNYATRSTDARILYASEGECAAVTIRREPGHRAKAAVGTTTWILGESIWVLAVGACAAWFWIGWFVVPVVGNLIIATFVAAWLRHRRLSEPVIIEITRDQVVFLNLNEHAKAQSFPRDRIYDVKHVIHSGCLVLRLRGMDMFECRPTPHNTEIEQIAGFLRTVLGLASLSEAPQLSQNVTCQ